MNNLTEKKLTELEKTAGDFWNISRETAEFLVDLVTQVDALKVLEIGTSNGYSGIWLANAVSVISEKKSRKGVFFTIESHDERFELARKNFLEAGISDYVFQIKGHAPEIFDLNFFREEVFAGEKFDFVFIDATKMQYKSFYEKVWPFLRIGGVIVADNILSHWDVLEGFANEVLSSRKMKSRLVELGTGLLISEKVIE